MRTFLALTSAGLQRGWRLVLLAFLAIGVQMAFRIALPISFQLIFDRAISSGDIQLLGRILLALCVFWLVQAAMSQLQDWAAARVGVRIMNGLRYRMYALLGRLPAEISRDLDSGDVMTRFTHDMASVEKATIQTLYILAFSALNIVLSIAMLFYLDWRLAAANFLGMLLGALAPRNFSKQAYRLQHVRREEESQVLATVQESIGTLDVIKAFNLWDTRLRDFHERLEQFRVTAMRAYLSGALVHRIGSQSATLVQVVIMGLGGYLVIQGSLTIGVMVAFIALLQNLVSAVSHLSGAMPDMIQASAAATRLHEFMAVDREESDDSLLPTLPRMREEFRLEDIQFGYRNDDISVKDIHMHLKRGSFTALVGTSGAGKSTILKLILRFYQPSQGKIFLDDVDISTHTRASLRDQIGVVPQDTVLFNTSIRENIRMGRLGASNEEIEIAAQAAGIHETITGLKEGYETAVEDHGRQLSGGQRQRLALARALLRNPPLLILDEATSALDPKTERGVMRTIAETSKDRAILFVTHRLNTVTDADQILVMDRGQIVESGRHQSLLDRNGLYAGLWEKQSGFEIEADGHGAHITPERLGRIPLFEGLPSQRLAELVTWFEPRYLPPDRVLFHKGDPGDIFYIIVDGLVEISFTREDQTLYRRILMDNGDFFGELALLDSAPRMATVRTRLPTLFLGLSAFRFRELMEQEPALRDLIHKAASNRRAFSG